MTCKPPCFGSNPSYQSQAENDCRNCGSQSSCLKIGSITFSEKLSHMIDYRQAWLEAIDELIRVAKENATLRMTLNTVKRNKPECNCGTCWECTK